MGYYKKYRLTQNISLAESINRFIRFIHGLPLLGKLTGDKYKFYGLKNFVFTLGPIFSVIGQIIKSFITFAMTMWPVGALIWATNIPWDLSEGAFDSFYNLSINSMGFLAFYLTGAFLSNAVVDRKQDIGKFNQQLRMNPKDAALSLAIFDPLRVALGRSIAFIVLYGLLDAFLMSFILLFIRIIGNSINLMAYKKTKKNIADNLWVIILVFIGLFFILKNIRRFSTTFLLGVFVVGLIASILSAKFLFAYKGYGEMLELAKSESLNISTDFEKISNDSLKLKDEDLVKGSTSTGHGYKFLNDLFFQRHRRLIIKPALKRSAIIFGIMVLALLVIKFKYPAYAKGINKYISIVIAELIFILYNNESTSRAMYLNCDRPLLRYGFYKNKAAIFDMYKYRYKSLLKLNSLGMLAAIVAVGIGFMIFAEITRSDFLVYIFFILASFIFYPAFNLGNYYLFQPYDSEANNAGHSYKWVSSIMNYVNILFIPLFIVNGTIDGLVLIKGLTIAMLIMSVAYPLIVKLLGGKTFKIR